MDLETRDFFLALEARQDAKSEARFNALETRFDSKWLDLETRFRFQMEGLRVHIDDVEARLRVHIDDVELRLRADTEGLRVHVSDLETHLLAHIEEAEIQSRAHAEEVETRLLAEFWKWARDSDMRERRNTTDIVNINEPIASLEDRVRDLERRRPHQ